MKAQKDSSGAPTFTQQHQPGPQGEAVDTALQRLGGDRNLVSSRPTDSAEQPLVNRRGTLYSEAVFPRPQMLRHLPKQSGSSRFLKVVDVVVHGDDIERALPPGGP